MKRFVILPLYLFAIGCAPIPTSAEDDLFDQTADAISKSDGNGVSSIQLGDSVSLSVLALAPGAAPTKANLAGRYQVFRFDVPTGQTFAAIMRARDGSAIDASLSLYDDRGEVIRGKDQAVLPSASQRDSVIVKTADHDTSYLLVASGQSFLSGGAFRLDLVALDAAPGVELGLTNGALRQLTDDLRKHEAELSALRETGVLAEQADGSIVVADLRKVPLDQRVATKALLARINDTRSTLFDEFVRANGEDEPSEEQIDAVGRTCASLWAAAR